MGALGDPTVRALLDESDCVLGIGVMLTDLGTGFWTQRIDPKARVMIDPDRVHVKYHSYDGLPITHVVAALLDRLPPSERPVRRFDSVVTAEYPIVAQVDRAGKASNSVIRIADVIAALQRLDQTQYSFVADVGDSWFISLELRTDVFLAAGYYASMGFAVPAALGLGIAEPTRRPLAIVGDGAFQMTGTELSTLVDQGLRPIVLLLNNGGYGMLEAIDGPRPTTNAGTGTIRPSPEPSAPRPSGSQPPPSLARHSNGPRPRLVPTSSRLSRPGTTSHRSWPGSETTSIPSAAPRPLLPECHGETEKISTPRNTDDTDETPMKHR